MKTLSSSETPVNGSAISYLKIQAHLNRKITHVNTIIQEFGHVNSTTIYKKVEGLHLLGRPQQGDLKYSKL